MSDEQFKLCTPPDGILGTNAIADALKSEVFRMGNLLVVDEVLFIGTRGRMFSFPSGAKISAGPVPSNWANPFKGQDISRMWFDDLEEGQGPWAISDMWRLR